MTKQQKIQLAALGAGLIFMAEALRRMGEGVQAGGPVDLPDFERFGKNLAGIIGGTGGDGSGSKNTGGGTGTPSPDAGQGDGSAPLPPRKPDTSLPGPSNPDRFSRSELLALTQQTISRYGFRVDPAVAAAICMVESAGKPGSIGDRNVPTGPAWGLMQVLRVTAQWLHDDVQYRAFPATQASLLTPEGGVYFGCAYLDWLQDYNGEARDRNRIIQSYNAGPGNGSSGYLTKVLQEMNRGAV